MPANVGDVLLPETHRVRFAGRALLRGPLLRGGGRRRERERVRSCMSHYRRYLSPACRAVFQGGAKQSVRRFRR
jgi:hypothetical protein